MNTVAIVQARLGSTRYPGKVLLPLCGKPMLVRIVERVAAAAGVRQVVVATTQLSQDDAIVVCCDSQGIACFRGSTEDVLDRYWRAACYYEADRVVRITADCPCIDACLIDLVIAIQADCDADLAGLATGAGVLGILPQSTGLFGFPDGLDVECYSRDALQRLWQTTSIPSDREHISPYAWKHPEAFTVERCFATADYGDHRWTVDHQEDYQLITAVYEALWRPDRHFTMGEVLGFLAEHPEVYALNRQWVGQEGYADLWGT